MEEKYYLELSRDDLRRVIGMIKTGTKAYHRAKTSHTKVNPVDVKIHEPSGKITKLDLSRKTMLEDIKYRNEVTRNRAKLENIDIPEESEKKKRNTRVRSKPNKTEELLIAPPLFYSPLMEIPCPEYVKPKEHNAGDFPSIYCDLDWALV